MIPPGIILCLVFTALTFGVGFLSGVGGAPGVLAACIGIVLATAIYLLPDPNPIRGPLGIVRVPAPRWVAPVGAAVFASSLAGWVYALVWAAGAL